MMGLVKQIAPIVGTSKACDALGMARASYYRFSRPKQFGPRRRRPTPSRALKPKERAQVLNVLHGERFIDTAPAEIYATLLEEGVRYCSERTMYRVLAAEGEVRERRNQLRHPSYEKPELLATAPNQVWSWDITKLRARQPWTYYYLYVLLDVYSRYVVGWMLAHHESGELAARLVKDTYKNQRVTAGQLTIHADRGSAPASKTLAQKYVELGVTRSHSRPYVSNDNPYSEAHFKTLKYRGDYPTRFASFEQALSYCRGFFGWYNREHRHSGIAMLTPAVVHEGRSANVLKARQRTLDAAYAVHPERFVNGAPSVAPLPEAAWINPPEDKARTESEIH